MVQVRYQVLQHVGVRQRVDLGLPRAAVDLAAWQRRRRRRRQSERSEFTSISVPDACQRVDAANVHGAGATNALPARTSECQSGVHLVLDLDQRVQDHWTALVQVHVVFLIRQNVMKGRQNECPLFSPAASACLRACPGSSGRWQISSSAGRRRRRPPPPVPLTSSGASTITPGISILFHCGADAKLLLR